jgi:antitoxin component of MazEF toxin-antitoxin module
MAVKNEALILEDLVAQITPDNLHNEHLKDEPKGNEIW